MATLPPYVSSVSSGRFRIAASESARTELKRAGLALTRDGVEWVLSGDDSDAAAAAIAKKLRSLGLAFSAGPGWSPSEVVQDLREKGLVEGRFDEIAWSGPDRWSVRAV
jgi:hypothetical protein